MCCEVGFKSADFCHNALIAQLVAVRCGFGLLTVCNCGNCVREVNLEDENKSMTFAVYTVLVFSLCNQTGWPHASNIWNSTSLFTVCGRQLVMFVVLITSAVSTKNIPRFNRRGFLICAHIMKLMARLQKTDCLFHFNSYVCDLLSAHSRHTSMSPVSWVLNKTTSFCRLMTYE